MTGRDPIEALASGAVSGASLLGLDGPDLDALVEQALAQAEHGQAEAARDRLVALAKVAPARPVLPLLVGHLEAQLSRPEGALAAYAEAARRLDDAGGGDSALGEDIRLAQAEIELSLGRADVARGRLGRVLASGSAAARARAEVLMRGVSS